jgi:uncharacterized protein YfaS (alpha-2-macroglobulin family)
LQVTPILVKTGEEATVTVDVMNTGTIPGETDVNLVIDGTVADSKGVSLDEGEQTNVTFSVSQEEAGSYEIQVGSSTAILEVEKSSIPAPGIIASVMVVLAVALLIRRNERKN